MKSSVLVLILGVCLSNCTDGRNSFSISIQYSSPWGSPVNYYLTENSIIVNGVKSFDETKTQTVYSRSLSKSESDGIYFFLKKTPYDTLKDSYENEHFFDGTTVIFKISGSGIKSKKVLTYMRSTVITDTLEKLVQAQVLDKRYKWNNYLDIK